MSHPELSSVFLVWRGLMIRSQTHRKVGRASLRPSPFTYIVRPDHIKINRRHQINIKGYRTHIMYSFFALSDKFTRVINTTTRFIMIIYFICVFSFLPPYCFQSVEKNPEY